MLYRLSFTRYVLFVLTWISIAIPNVSTEKRNKQVYCGACMALVFEINEAISSAPDEKIEVGVWRINPDGSSGTKMKSVARSELYLMELLEKVAQNMTFYTEYTHANGQRGVIRTGIIGGNKVSTRRAKPDSPVTKGLRHACDTIVEEYEDIIMELFKNEKNEVSDIRSRLCIKETSYCTEDDIKAQQSAQGEAIFLGMQEQKEEKVQELWRKNKEKEKEEKEKKEMEEDDDEDKDENTETDETPKDTDDKKDEL